MTPTGPVIGLDLSLNWCGVAVLQPGYGTTTATVDLRKLPSFGEKYAAISGVAWPHGSWPNDTYIIEEGYIGPSRWGSLEAATWRGYMLGVLEASGRRVFMCSSRTAKVAVLGKAATMKRGLPKAEKAAAKKAAKKAIQTAVEARFGIKCGSEHEADALSLICAMLDGRLTE